MALTVAISYPKWETMSLVLGAILFLSFLARLYRTWHRLAHIPGPRWAGLSKWWMLRNTLRGDMHLALKRACDEYGM